MKRTLEPSFKIESSPVPALIVTLSGEETLPNNATNALLVMMLLPAPPLIEVYELSL